MKEGVILIISPERWNGHFVSKHHYAITLALQEHKVYFLNPPENDLTGIKVQKTQYTNVSSVSAPQVAKGLRFYPKFLRNYVERKWLKELEQKLGKSFTTVWLFENSRFYDMDFAEDRVKIYHQVDSNQKFHIKEASKSADTCFCTTNYIKNELLHFTKSVYKIHHGVTLGTQECELTQNQEEYFKYNAINAVCIGNLDISFFDINLFSELVKSFPQINFHLVGNYSNEKALFKTCGSFTNIRWWGRVESKCIPIILALCDVQLLIYKSNKIEDEKQLASPHKMMEYLASGKVTVSTYTDEYKDKRELLEMVDSSDDYLARFDEVVNHLDDYNAKEKQNLRMKFAKENSYEKQLSKIVGYLKQYNLKL